MKFSGIKRFTGSSLGGVVDWLTGELNSALRELFIGLRGLDFEENFGAFAWEGTLAAAEVKQIPHPFNLVPRGYIIQKQVGDVVVDASSTAWTSQAAYLRNTSGVDPVTIRVLFFR